MSEKKLNINEIIHYANKSGVDITDPKYSELPDDIKCRTMKRRVKQPEIESYGFYADDDLIFVGGCEPVNQYTGETYSVALDNTYRKTILRISKMFCDLWIQEDYHRLQTLIKEQNKKAYEFNKLLGFEEEAFIKKLTESNYFLLRRLRNHD